jgi:HAD superfamily hydrolase (TIGR01549 family)
VRVGGTWVVLDVGETLVDETRVYATWADVLGVPRFTLAALVGGAIARAVHEPDRVPETAGLDPLGAAFDALGLPDWYDRADQVERAYGGFTGADLYPDALRCLDGLRAAGHRVAVVANQPAARDAQLRRLGLEAEVMAMSEAIGVHKPDADFFTTTLHLLGDPDPGDVAYVGDRVDNDVAPAARAGLRPVWIRRGPWALLHRDTDHDAALEVRTLDELVDRAGELWA